METIKFSDQGMHLLLACGHHSEGLHADSSIIALPDAPLWCRQCSDERQMHPLLQTMIYETRDYDEPLLW